MRRRTIGIALAGLTLSMFARRGLCGDPGEAVEGMRERGPISYYGRRFESKITASGEPFDADALTMAHRALPFGSMVRVTNLRNRRSVVVRVNDRGPHVAGRIADVSLAAARALGMVGRGIVPARLEVLSLGNQADQAPASR